MAETDVQLELKKRARRRLVGAAALALAAAIVLPMVMDEAPPQSAGELSIRIPGQEGSNVVVQPIASPPVEPAASAPVASPPLEPVPASESAPAAQPAEIPAPAASVPSVAPVRPAASAPERSDAARAQAILAGRDPAPTARSAPAATRYFVQLGVYRDPDNVKSVQARAKTAGFKAVTEKVGTNTRVRVGPYASREAADAALAKLKKSGLNAVVAEAH